MGRKKKGEFSRDYLLKEIEAESKNLNENETCRKEVSPTIEVQNVFDDDDNENDEDVDQHDIDELSRLMSVVEIDDGLTTII